MAPLAEPTLTTDAKADPPLADQSAAALVVGEERWECNLFDVSLEAFGVSVPTATALDGEPIARLITNDSNHPVRIIRQQAVETGFRFTLKRLDPHDPALKPIRKPLPQWLLAFLFGCAAGLIGLVASEIGYKPDFSSNNLRSLTVVRAVRLVQTWLKTGDFRTAHADAANSGTGPFTGERRSSDQLLDLPAIPVSLSADDRARRKSAQSGQAPAAEENLDPQELEIAKATRRAQLTASLKSVRRGPRQPASSDTLPWLFTTGDSTLGSSRNFRMSELAARDLSLFESGLNSLPVTTRHEAIRSFKRALAAMTTTAGLSAEQEELPEVRLIRSDDAVIYFQRAGEHIDILRAVPRETPPSTSSRSNSPTSGLSPDSMQR